MECYNVMKIKYNENLDAIYTYLRSYEYYVDILDLIQFCVDYEYYKELYENWHIVYQCLMDHNKRFPYTKEQIDKMSEGIPSD